MAQISFGITDNDGNELHFDFGAPDDVTEAEVRDLAARIKAADLVSRWLGPTAHIEQYGSIQIANNTLINFTETP